MTDTQPQFLPTGRKSLFFVFLLPIVLLLVMAQSLSAREIATPLGSPSLFALKTANTAQMVPGGTVHYTIVITNSAGIDVSNVIMTDTLPTEFSVVTTTLSTVRTDALGGNATVVNDVVMWNGTLGATTGKVQIEFDAVLTDTAVIGNIITNTAQVTGASQSVAPSAAIEVVDTYKIYMPLLFNPLDTPTLLSVGLPTSNDDFNNFSMLVTWQDVGDPNVKYQLEESHDSNFTTSTIYDAGTGTTYSVSHAASTNNYYYYRLRTMLTGSNMYSDWSNIVWQGGPYADGFNDASSGWAMRREDTDDTKNDVYYNDGKLKLKIGGRWDSMIVSPMSPIPTTWSSYRIHTRVKLEEGVDNLHSYGIVFGGDWDGVNPCPNSNFTSCFNRYYRLNIVWSGNSSSLKAHLKRIDRHDTSDNSDEGETLMSFQDVFVGDPDGWNDWEIEVFADGTMKLYANGNLFHTAHDTTYNTRGKHFGTFASADEYLGSAPWYEFYRVTPLP